MIEHFKKFDRGDKSLLPLSFSHLNEFAFYRERWALRRIFGYEFPSSASAERGTAVESGLHMLLRGMEKEQAVDRMYKIYDDNCSNLTDTRVEEEKANLIPLLDLGASQFQENAFKWELLDYQKKVELEIFDIPIIGYTDFHFEDKNTKEDFFIDLKTSKIMPSTISLSHAMQQSIYHKATNSRQMLWYLKTPTKTKDAEFKPLELYEYSHHLKICEHIVKAMAFFLSKVDTPEEVKQILIPNIDNWIWKEETVLNARKEVWGF